MKQEQSVLNQPFIQLGLIDMMMSAGIIEYNDGQRHWLWTLGNAVDQVDDGGAIYRWRVQVIPEFARGKIQCANDVHTVPVHAGIGRMGLALRCPSSLYIGNIRKTALIEIKQAKLIRASGGLHAIQVALFGFEACRVAFFFNESRARINDNPRFFKCLAKESRLKGGVSGWISRI